MKRLTEAQVRGLKSKRRTSVSDGDTGLVLRVTPNGVKTWAVSYALKDRAAKPRTAAETGSAPTRPMRRTVKLGRYPSVTLADARELAASVLGDVAKGLDPGAPKTMAPPSDSVVELVRRYLKTRKGLAPVTVANYDGMTDRLGKSPLGRRPAAEVQRVEVREHLEGMARVAANRLNRLIAAALRWGTAEEIVARNPADLLDRNPEKSRERVLTDDELRAVWSADVDPEVLAYARFLVLCGLRRTEASLISWEDLRPEPDGTCTLVVPREHRKGGKAGIQRSLPHSAHRVLGERGTGRVFPTISRRYGRAATAIWKASGTSGWTWHDLRRTCTHGLEAMGTPPHVLSAILGHSASTVSVRGGGQAVTGTYTSGRRQAEVDSALAAWAAHVESVVTGRTKDNVLALVK